MHKIKNLVTLSFAILGLSLVTVLAHPNLTTWLNSESGKSVSATGNGKMNSSAPVIQAGCDCDAGNNGQYCGPSGAGCEAPPVPFDDQGCGWKTGPPGCDDGKCCTKIFT